MPAKTVSIAETISQTLPKIFEQSQNTTANHQKNRVVLYKIHKEAASQIESVQNGKSLKLVGEKAFEDGFINMVNHILQSKKGVTFADRVVKFIGGYVKFINEKATEEKTDDDDDEDTTASRFVARLLRHLLKGFLAKDKSVRYRVLQVVSEMISHLGEIDDDVYTLLRTSLLERITDKEIPIRLQAAIALSKLAGAEDTDDEVDNDAPNALEVLIDILQYDPAAEVRRATLLNIPISQRTLPAILSRTRDVDDVIRKIVYSHVLSQIPHPKQLTISQRELIVRNGLGDRQPPVRAAAAKLVASWVDLYGGDLLEFLKSFDLIVSEVSEDVLLSVFVTKTEILDKFQFDDEFWKELTPEKAFLVRVFVDHCINKKDEARLETCLPVVTALAFKIQSAYNDLLEQMQVSEELCLSEEVTEEEQEANEDARSDQEFVISELLKLVVNLDYADEIGRRKMFSLVRDMISQESLPEKLMGKCLDVLRALSPNERDLIRVVVEVVHELRDQGESERSQDLTEAEEATQAGDTPRTIKVMPGPQPPEMSEEAKARAALLDLRCLNLCIGMLERVNGTFEDNSTLEGILGELILPSVRAKELALREKGLVSLGLCCLIAKRMALNSFQLFINQVQAAPEVLRIRVLKIVFDILMVHESEFLGRAGDTGERIVEFLLHILENEESDEVQAVTCMGIAKLMLSGMITDQRIAIEAYTLLSETYADLDAESEMISPNQVAFLLADWTDPRNVMEVSGKTNDDTIHIDLAIDVVKVLLKTETSRDDKKVLSQTLGKLFLPDEIEEDKIRTLKLLIDNVQRRRPPKDSVTKNALIKFGKTIEKKFAAQLGGFNEEDFRKLEDLKELFEFLDDVMSDEEGEMPLPPKKRGGERSRSVSVMSDDEFESPNVKGKSTKRKNKTRTALPVTPRTLPRRAARARSSIIKETTGSGTTSSESDDGDVNPSPSVKRKARTSKEQPLPKRKRESDPTPDEEGSEPDDDDDDDSGEDSANTEDGEINALIASEDEESE
ncbi:hypothetical protein Clacol_009337 [Clathrus columnatus]|uniref:Nuclear condensin complex subunit 3 C-terminal domain-containing protein n=1 Tax=Clathrus columnatus TaxID=1419009 RepID=A0AAV5AK74_9AGAM|nr:hypothetical protein Clacol_009337 [Clathrus columnatus]